MIVSIKTYNVHYFLHSCNVIVKIGKAGIKYFNLYLLFRYILKSSLTWISKDKSRKQWMYPPQTWKSRRLLILASSEDLTVFIHQTPPWKGPAIRYVWWKMQSNIQEESQPLTHNQRWVKFIHSNHLFDKSDRIWEILGILNLTL